jgi:hypothetical protein
VTVNWQTWYNFRTKHRVQGSYEIYLDDLLIKNESHLFNKWWLPSTLSVTLDQLSSGEHNVTAIIADEEGNYATNTVIIQIAAAHDLRDGPKSLELAVSERDSLECSLSFQSYF